VGQVPVIAHRHPETGHDVEADGQASLRKNS
jgi:hypothetical protein